MDITTFRQYLADAKTTLDQYEVAAAKVTATSTATNGVLTVNGYDMAVSGSDFDTLLYAEVTESVTERNTLLNNLEDIVDLMKLHF